MRLNNRNFHGFLKSVDTTGKSASFEIYRRLYGLQLNLCIRTENPFTFETHSRCVQNIRQYIRPLADLSVPAEFHLCSFTVSVKACSMRPRRVQPKTEVSRKKMVLYFLGSSFRTTLQYSNAWNIRGDCYPMPRG